MRSAAQWPAVFTTVTYGRRQPGRLRSYVFPQRCSELYLSGSRTAWGRVYVFLSRRDCWKSPSGQGTPGQVLELLAIFHFGLAVGCPTIVDSRLLSWPVRKKKLFWQLHATYSWTCYSYSSPVAVLVRPFASFQPATGTY